ncbi:TorF family putative porin [Sphingomonas sp. IC-11]|uniref:TorF family putative porin n=1 Tax=Sphingomonas sp. IC-11 TaxID=2898528 RepID=UPI001E3DB71F|nr:TorF family putative porin [Sphingomonas sp. IC-11]MCD2317068.1 TorF family putative porin [Sphingomonas sp. IC-11]
MIDMRDIHFLAAAVCGLASAQPALAEPWTVSGEASLVSDYNSRGLSLSGRKPAVQAGLSLSNANGMHADVWSSTISRTAKGARAEVDISLGYTASLEGDGALDVGVTYYHYPSDSELDFIEMTAEVTQKFGTASVTGAIAYAPKQDLMRAPDGRLRDNVYVSLDAEQPIAGTPFSLVAHAGYERGYFDGCLRGGKLDWSVGALVNWKGVALGAYYVDSEASSFEPGVRDFAGSTGLLSASISF